MFTKILFSSTPSCKIQFLDYLFALRTNKLVQIDAMSRGYLAQLKISSRMEYRGYLQTFLREIVHK